MRIRRRAWLKLDRKIVSMGGLCSKRSVVDKSPSESTLDSNGLKDHEAKSYHSASNSYGNFIDQSGEGAVNKGHLGRPLSFSERILGSSGSGVNGGDYFEPQLLRVHSQKSRSTKSKPVGSGRSGTSKVSEMSMRLGRAGTVGLGKAVEVLDTLGSSMTSLNLSSNFVSGGGVKGNKVSILAFEVANTIMKGSNLVHSLSKENVRHLKEEVLPSEGVQLLVSKDMDELLRTAASDKREELKVFSGEVVRFGNRCKDPQWHNLDRYFEKLESELTPQNYLKEDAETIMHQLMTLVQYTAELYHELNALDRFELDYRRRLQEEENTNVAQRGDDLQILRQELKSQRKHVKSLKKKSLWSKNLEEIMEKLVDIVHYLHLEIHEAFDGADEDKSINGSVGNHQRLGPAGLSLHYANIISQIDTMVSRSSSVPPNTRDSLYQGLPPSIKSVLRSKLQLFQVKEEIAVPQIKVEMEKTLRWLLPIATNTTKAHHGFGWVGEWASTGTDINWKSASQTDFIRIETLHHADKNKTEAYILELVVWLHYLISLSRPGNGGMRSPVKSPIRSPTQKSPWTTLSPSKPSTPSPMLTQEDQEMLRVVNFRKLTPGISKSQEFDTFNAKLSEHSRLSKSNSHSPSSESRKEFSTMRKPSIPFIDFDIDKLKALDVIDRVETLRKL